MNVCMCVRVCVYTHTHTHTHIHTHTYTPKSSIVSFKDMAIKESKPANL